MKLVLTIIGILLLFSGLLWLGQGTGLVDWPASSFMIDQRPWIYRGAITALIGAAFIWVGRRR